MGETNAICSTRARRRRVATQIRARRRLINVEKPGQVDSVVPVITNVENPATEHFALDVHAPLRRVGILISNRNAALQLRRSCRK